MKKKTYLYKVEMLSTITGDEKITYFYGRNKEYVKLFCKENYYPIIKYNSFKITMVGTCKYTVKEPVVEFNDDEKEQIDNYFMSEALKYIKNKMIDSSTGEMTDGTKETAKSSDN